MSTVRKSQRSSQKVHAVTSLSSSHRGLDHAAGSQVSTVCAGTSLSTAGQHCYGRHSSCRQCICTPRATSAQPPNKRSLNYKCLTQQMSTGRRRLQLLKCHTATSAAVPVHMALAQQVRTEVHSCAQALAWPQAVKSSTAPASTHPCSWLRR